MRKLKIRLLIALLPDVKEKADDDTKGYVNACSDD